MSEAEKIMRDKIIDLAKEVNIKISLYSQEAYAKSKNPDMMAGVLFQTMNLMQFVSLVITIHATGTNHALAQTARMKKDGLLSDPDFIKDCMKDFNRLKEQYDGEEK